VTITTATSGWRICRRLFLQSFFDKDFQASDLALVQRAMSKHTGAVFVAPPFCVEGQSEFLSAVHACHLPITNHLEEGVDLANLLPL
jgi:hypothetical protein